MRVGVYHSRHDDAPRAVHNFRCLEAPLQVLTCAHRHNPILLDAYARAFEHFTPLVHRNQPRIGKNETHRRSPSRLGMKYLWDMVSGHRCGEWQIQRDPEKWSLLRRLQARTRPRRELAQVHTYPLQADFGKIVRPSTWQLPF